MTDVEDARAEAIAKGPDVHTEHCCIKHGCKYGDETCTVTTGAKTQSFPCHYCHDDKQEIVEATDYPAIIDQLRLVADLAEKNGMPESANWIRDKLPWKRPELPKFLPLPEAAVPGGEGGITKEELLPFNIEVIDFVPEPHSATLALKFPGGAVINVTIPEADLEKAFKT